MKTSPLVAAAALGVVCLGANAQHNSVRLGIDDIANHASSSSLSSNGPAFLTPQPAGVTVGNASTLVLGYTRTLSEHWDAELVIGLPPNVDASGTGTLQTFGTVAHVKEVGPNVFLIYNFGHAGDRWRPFAGAGINYTRFYDARSTDSGDLASGGPTKISLTPSKGWAAKAGASYEINRQWALVGAVAALKVKSDMTTSTGSIERRTTIDFRPVVYSVGLTYRF